MCSSAQRLFSVLILAFWMAPSAMALGLGLHMALDAHAVLEHQHHEAEHTQALADLARAAEHGHHHDAEAVPDHEHEALVDGVSPVSRSGADLIATLPLPRSLGTSTAERSRPERPSRRGPPTPLFTANCSLLI